MQHLALKAASTATDRGEFSAIAAAYSVDRQRERIEFGAFAKTIAAWRERGREIPLHWNHSPKPEDIIGTVRPASMHEEEGVGLHVRGQLDIGESEVAREVWRLVKANSVALSFGFLTVASHEDGEVKVLDEIDLFEITITPAPANADTRVLSTKAADGAPLQGFLATIASTEPKSIDEMSIAELKAHGAELTKDIDMRPAPRIVSFEC